MQTVQAKKKPIEISQNDCYHCGEDCQGTNITIEDKPFCCQGCKMVYEILNENDMCRYYDIDEQAGVSLKGKTIAEYAYLDEPEVQERLLIFNNGKIGKINFHLPQIHCASCIWLLENLYRLNEGIDSSRVNFLKKEITLTYQLDQTSLRKIVELLASIGYTPSINLSDLDQKEKPVVERKFYYKLGVAGFAFGNIMLLSFPEYLGLDKSSDAFFYQVFGYLNIILAIPLVFFSGSDYLRSAWLGLKNGMLNIDVPISLGVLTLFGRSVFEILTHTGAGYLDSLAGLVFFLLVGKWFQQRTYHHISFERDYKSYFPISANLKKDKNTSSVSLDQLKPGDTIVIKSQELIPADGILLKGHAEIDYSFVTGESAPEECQTGDKLFAGGRQMSGTIEMSLTKKVAQSYLTQLWNDEAFSKEQNAATVELANRVGKFFTIVILLIAFTTLAYWVGKDMAIAINAFTAVLIIACPCAVALAIPFIFGNTIRLLGKNQFYLKNTSVVEKISRAQSIIFDKTGTLTLKEAGRVSYEGEQLSKREIELVYMLTQASNHPVSRSIHKYLYENGADKDPANFSVSKWKETAGLGITAQIEGKHIKLGAAQFMDTPIPELEKKGTLLQIDGRVKGIFITNNKLRPSTTRVLEYFRSLGDIFLLSGDHDGTKGQFLPYFGEESHLKYRQSPKDKLNFVRSLQAKEQKVMMLGDGLNDAGALQQSDIGIVISEDTNNFTPACDAILAADQFENLPKYIQFTKQSVRLVYWAYAFAFVYNVIGLSFAVQGALSPIIAAILMPLSSISIVVFGLLGSEWAARKRL